MVEAAAIPKELSSESTTAFEARSSRGGLGHRQRFWQFAVGLILFLIYNANFRVIGIGDAVPASLLPLAMYRGDGTALDRFRPALVTNDQLPYFVAQRQGHLVSLYPIGPALLAIPLVWPQIFVMDVYEPHWDDDAVRALKVSMWMGKLAAAAMTSLACVLLMSILSHLHLQSVAAMAALAAGLGSDLWVIASQSLWQHGPAALSLSVAILALVRRNWTPGWLFVGGAASAALVSCRLPMLVFAVCFAAAVVRREGWRGGWFFVVPSIVGVALLAHNYWLFDSILGGARILESPAEHLRQHHVAGAWSGSLLGGWSGTLFSPNRGLFVFCPWVALALITLPWTYQRFSGGVLMPVILAVLPTILLINSTYAVWWGGFSFGPRYWTETTILFAIVLAAGYAWSRTTSRTIRLCFRTGILFAIVAQSIGAFCYPSGWNWEPVSVDTRHERLWDFRDNELSRCLHTGPRPWGRIDGIPLPD